MEGPLSWGYYVRALRVQGEEGTAVIQNESVSGNRDAGSERVIDAVDEGHEVAPAIGGSQVYGAADRIAFALGRQSLAQIDPPALLSRVVFRDQLCYRNRGEARVGVVGIQVLVGELLGFDQHVPIG